jgi:hypothetical protein
MITIDKFNELTTELIGQPLTQVTDSYGDVVVLHFGNLTNYTHPMLSHLKQGVYRLVIKMSSFIFVIDENRSELINKQLTELDINDKLDLQLTFDNKSINILPEYSETELPYWELWMPGDNYIVADNTGLQLLDKHSYVA